MRMFFALVFCCALVGCGQKGPLSMPGAEASQQSNS
ncbi:MULTISPECIES: lipoprotein [unclassified Marinobacterium]|nr:MULTISPECIES: lipoprotein [unclassified Marinobacterium]